MITLNISDRNTPIKRQRLSEMIKKNENTKLSAGDGQGSLVCCSPWSHKESDMTE